MSHQSPINHPELIQQYEPSADEDMLQKDSDRPVNETGIHFKGKSSIH